MPLTELEVILLRYMLNSLKEKRKKSQWEEKIERTKRQIKIMKTLNSAVFRDGLKINFKCFMELLSLVRPHFEEYEDDNSVSTEERLLATLKYVATGCSFDDLTISNCLSKEAVARTVLETCKAIFKSIKIYIKMPSTEQEWKSLSASFQSKWHFSHCVGAIGGKHIAIKEPADDGPSFYNYKQFHSIIVVASVNADYQFDFVEVGINGGLSHPPALRFTETFFENLIDGSLNLPPPEPLPGTSTEAPYVFVGDNSIELVPNAMTPFMNDVLPDQQIYNYRLSRARRCFENAFGILYSRFGIFRQDICMENLGDVNSMVLACCALHNFLIRHNPDYISDDLIDRENLYSMSFEKAKWRLEAEGKHWRDTHPIVSICDVTDDWSDQDEATNIRKTFCGYFNNEGVVPFQVKMSDIMPSEGRSNAVKQGIA